MKRKKYLEVLDALLQDLPVTHDSELLMDRTLETITLTLHRSLHFPLPKKKVFKAGISSWLSGGLICCGVKGKTLYQRSSFSQSREPMHRELRFRKKIFAAHSPTKITAK